MHLPQDARALVERIRPEVVFHLAAPVNPDGAKDEDTARSAIVDGTTEILSACAKTGARLVHIGTCAEYGPVSTPYRESQECQPAGLYGQLKYEASCRVTSAKGVVWSVLRPFRSIGPGDSQSVVALAAHAAVQRLPFEMTDGLQVREWNDVRAVAQAVVAAGAHPGAIDQIINVGGGPRMSVRSIVERVYALAGVDTSLVRAGARPRRAHEVDSLFGDHSKATVLWGPIKQPELDQLLQQILDKAATRVMVNA